MPIVEGLQQQTPEWLHQRHGMVTGSRVADVVGRKRPTAEQKKAGMPGDYYKARQDYLWDVIIERLTGRSAETYVTPAMEFGIENEPLARAAYELEKDVEVEAVGFAIHPQIEWFGASPDGLVGTDGCLEIKVPNSSTHLAYLLEGEIPVDYMPQMMAEMACAERKWCDFVSFDPRLPPKLRFFCRRFHRNDALIAQMETEIRAFLEEVTLKLGELATRASDGPTAHPGRKGEAIVEGSR